MNKELSIIVTGSKGQLGYDCVKILKERGYNHVFDIDINDVDLTDEEAVNQFFDTHKPDVVMHNAAWTAVDKAEQFPEEVRKVNVLATSYIAKVCKKYNAKLFFISTDYVFNGQGNKFYEVDDPKGGLSVYGKSKSDAEDLVKTILDKYFIIRTSWAFGINGNNFVKSMINQAENGTKELLIVDDQIGSPTYTCDLAFLMCDMMETEKYGIYHATNEGVCSWAEFASFIFKEINSPLVVKKVSTEEYMKVVKNQAVRPLNSRLSKESLVKAGFNKLPTWQDAVKRYIHEELKK